MKCDIFIPVSKQGDDLSESGSFEELANRYETAAAVCRNVGVILEKYQGEIFQAHGQCIIVYGTEAMCEDLEFEGLGTSYKFYKED